MKAFDKYAKYAPDYHYRQIDRKDFKRYNAFVDARFQKLRERALEFIESKQPSSPLKILDVGCGDGVALYLIKEGVPRSKIDVFGIDQSEDALKVAREKNPGGVFARGSAEKIEFSNDEFDLVISSDVIEHVEDPQAMMNEMRRVTKVGGSVIVGTPVRMSKFPEDHNHVQEFFVEDFKELAGKDFHSCEVHESHNVILTLLYNYPTKSFMNFRYLINMLSIFFNYNPFTKERSNNRQIFSYMYAVCKK